LDDDGLWLFEQSYMPEMLKRKSYDTICHEHLEYYRLKQIHWMTERVGFKIVDLEFNPVNGGSFAIIVAKRKSSFKEAKGKIRRVLKQEEQVEHLHRLEPYRDFKRAVASHKEQLLAFLREVKRAKQKILGYGASTKGNVILQYAGITADLIPAIAEVNSDKFGCFTPGSGIPIISEEEARAQNPDYLMVLPWHFRDNIIQREKAYLRKGGKLVFPLPDLEILE
jgi:hypothetical protein